MKRVRLTVDPVIEAINLAAVHCFCFLKERREVVFARHSYPLSSSSKTISFPTRSTVGVLPGLQGLRIVALTSSVVNDHEPLAALVRPIIGIVEERVLGIMGCKGLPVTAVRVVTIH